MNHPDERKAGKHLSDIEIAQILALGKVNISQRKIASLLKCSRKAVEDALTTYCFETFQGCNPRREYKRKTTEREDRYIERALKQNNSLPLRDITNIIGLPISENTVRRRRSEAGLGSYIAAEKPGLRAENVAKRLQWALKYKDWTVEDWKRVIWSDESSIWIGVNPRRQWVIRPPEERLNRKYVKKTFKSVQVKVMVWACFTGERLGPLIVCDAGGIGADEYEDILYDGLFSLVDDLSNYQKTRIQFKSRKKILFCSCTIMLHATKQHTSSSFSKKIMFPSCNGHPSRQTSIPSKTYGLT